MLFQQQTIMIDSEYAKHASKSNTASAENSPYLLLSSA